MSSRFDPNNHEWQDLYRAAIFETDHTKRAGRIAQAEWAITVRRRSLFNQPGSATKERRALDAAFDALRILERCAKETSAA